MPAGIHTFEYNGISNFVDLRTVKLSTNPLSMIRIAELHVNLQRMKWRTIKRNYVISVSLLLPMGLDVGQCMTRFYCTPDLLKNRSSFFTCVVDNCFEVLTNESDFTRR